VILRLTGPGDVLGGVGQCAGCEHCSTARTVQQSSALVWETAQFEAISERYPMLRRNIALVLERRLNELGSAVPGNLHGESSAAAQQPIGAAAGAGGQADGWACGNCALSPGVGPTDGRRCSR
jgi:CRP-like cAMP-binding protein